MIGTEGEIKRDYHGVIATGREGRLMMGTEEGIKRDCCEVMASGRERGLTIGTKEEMKRLLWSDGNWDERRTNDRY